MKPTLLVLAAGMGSRYGGLKQVDPVGPSGEILLEYSVYDALRAGFGRLVFVIRKDIESAFQESIGSRLRGKIPIDYAFQELGDLPSGFTLPSGRSKPWGTAHAILATRDVIQEPFVAINADDFYGKVSFQAISDHLQTSNGDYSMVGFHLRNTLSEHGSVSRGLCQVQDGHLTSVVEHTKIERLASGQIVSHHEGAEVSLTGDEIVSMNFWGLYPSIYPELDTQFRAFLQTRGQEEKSELYIPSVLDQIIREGRGRVKVLESPESWFGVTYPQDKPIVVEQIRARVQQGLYPENLWA